MPPLPCPTHPPCPTGWTHPGGDPWCCASPDGMSVFCYSVTPCPTPTPAVVPTLEDQGLWLFATLVLCVGIRLISLRQKEAR